MEALFRYTYQYNETTSSLRYNSSRHVSSRLCFPFSFKHFKHPSSTLTLKRGTQSAQITPFHQCRNLILCDASASAPTPLLSVGYSPWYPFPSALVIFPLISHPTGSQAAPETRLDKGATNMVPIYSATSVCANVEDLSCIFATTTPALFQRANFTCTPLGRNTSVIFNCVGKLSSSGPFTCVNGVEVGEIFIGFRQPGLFNVWEWYTGTPNNSMTDCSDRQENYMTQQTATWTYAPGERSLLGMFEFGGTAFSFSNFKYSKCVKVSR